MGTARESTEDPVRDAGLQMSEADLREVTATGNPVRNARPQVSEAGVMEGTATENPVRDARSQVSEAGVMEVMSRFYAAEAEYVAAGGSGDFTEVAALLDPEVVLYQAPGLPFTGTGSWRGHRGLQAFLDLFAEIWQSMELIETRAVVDGDTVVMLLNVRFRSRATGRSVETRIAQVNVVADDRITEFRPYYWDPVAITEACT